MKKQEYRRFFISMISMLLVCVSCFAAFAEGTAAGPENEAVPEEEDADFTPAGTIIGHRFWGFFVGWAEGDTYRMLDLCSAEWKSGQEVPFQALQKILGSEKPQGYKISRISGKDGDPVVTASITLLWEAGEGGYSYSLHEIACRLEPDGYAIDPDGFGSGVPTEPVPEEETVMLTPEAMMRDRLDSHEEAGLYEKMIPINAGVERLGIRVEVISGLIQGQNVWLIISLQDTEGKYNGQKLEPSFMKPIDSSSSRRWMELYHDSTENRSVYAVCQELDRQIQPEERNLAVGVSSIRVNETETIDLLPLLKQYGKTEEGITPPELEEYKYTPDAPDVPEDVRILNYRQPLDVSLYRDVCLTGIGWIGDQLHIQYQNKGAEFLDILNGRASACSVWTDASVYGKAYWESDVEYSPLCWDGDNDGWSEWSEFIVNCKPEEAEQLEARAEITITTAFLENDWRVLIPMSMIYLE